METTLDELKDSLKKLAKQIGEKMGERQSYLDQAGKIQEVYDRMHQDKQIVQKYKKDIKGFYKKAYDDFQGNNFKYVYKPEIKNLINTYEDVIKKIDINLDALNTAKLSYENKASNCLGPLGWLESSYNSIKTQIQNWTN